jgi:hypothetical protein
MQRMLRATGLIDRLELAPNYRTVIAMASSAD